MISHPLFDALVQPSQPLPAHFRPAGVGMPKALPRLLRFGSVAPPQSGGSQFSGGRVSQPQTSLVHPQAAQGFTPPTYSPSNPTAPSLAPFVSTPQGGPPTGPPFNAGGDQTGATPQPPSPPPFPSLGSPDLAQHGTNPPSPVQNGSFLPPQQGTFVDQPAFSSPYPVQNGSFLPPQQGTFSGMSVGPMLLSLLAQQGQKLNPSAGNLRYFS